jgi:hypothetical protein
MIRALFIYDIKAKRIQGEAFPRTCKICNWIEIES